MNGEQDTMYYVHKDHLGSFDVVTDEEGNVMERYSFDPWGRRRNPVDGSFNNVPTPRFFDRGYTGHEHLDIFGLINMNGRVYDPWLSRFLSPDPFVQTPAHGQSFNRYSYCLNNPLKYVDPSGYNRKPFFEWEANATYYFGGGGFTGRIGPGSGNHWSDGMNSFRDYSWMNKQTFENYYGIGAYEVASSINSNPAMQQQWRSGNINMHEVMMYGSYWNPIAGDEAYRESIHTNGKHYVNIYCYGKWVSVFSNIASIGIDGLDWTNTTDGQKIIHFMDAIREARLSGKEYIDVRQLFSNFPKYGIGVDIINDIKIDNNLMTVHMILAIYDNMKIDIYPARMDLVGPFDRVSVNGIIKEGYWDMMELNRTGGNIPMLMIEINSNFEIFYNYLYK